MSSELKKMLTKVVVSETDAKKTGKSKGTKIGTNNRIIPTIVIAPFSL